MGHRSTKTRLVVLSVVLLAAVTLAACGRMGIGSPVVDVPGGDPALGKSALDQYACVTCHSVPGVNGPNTYVGPPLTAWAERNFITGKLPNEPDYLIQFIMDPQGVEPGTAMPDLGVTEADARHIAAYLFTLEDD